MVRAAYPEKSHNHGKSVEFGEFQVGQYLQYRLCIICSHAREAFPTGRGVLPFQAPGALVSNQADEEEITHQTQAQGELHCFAKALGSIKDTSILEPLCDSAFLHQTMVIYYQAKVGTPAKLLDHGNSISGLRLPSPTAAPWRSAVVAVVARIPLCW